MTPSISPVTTSVAIEQTRQDLRDQATKLEAFLFAEMLKVSDTGKSSLANGAQSQFQSLLWEQQAQAVAGSGQTGLADQIYLSLAKGSGVA